MVSMMLPKNEKCRTSWVDAAMLSDGAPTLNAATHNERGRTRAADAAVLGSASRTLATALARDTTMAAPCQARGCNMAALPVSGGIGWLWLRAVFRVAMYRCLHRPSRREPCRQVRAEGAGTL